MSKRRGALESDLWEDLGESKTLQRYQTLVDTVGDGIYQLDADGQFVEVNNILTEMTDYTRDDLLGDHISLIFDEDDCQRIEREISQQLAIDDQQTNIFEVTAQTAGGEMIPCELRLSPLIEDDEFQGTVGIVRDIRKQKHTEPITERQELEQELHESEAKFRQLVEHLDQVVWMTTSDQQELLYVNPVFEEVYGRDRERLYEDPEILLDAVHPDDRERIRKEFDKGADGEYEVEYRIVRPSGEVRWIHDRAIPIYDDDGDVYRIIGQATDITDQKEFESMLTELYNFSQQLLTDKTKEEVSNTIVDMVSDVLNPSFVICYRYDVDRDMLVPDANSAAADFPSHRLPELPADGDSRTAQVFEDGKTHSYDAETEPPLVRVNTSDTDMKSGLFVPVGEYGVVVAGACESNEINDKRRLIEVLATNAQSAYDRVEREQYVRDAKAQLEAATEAGAVGTWEWQIPEDQMITGPSFARTFGVDPDAAREGVSLDRFVSSIHEADRNRVEAAIEEAIESGGEYQEEYRVWNAEDELRWVIARGYVEYDDDGNPLAFPGALVDFTERKRAEQQLQQHKKQLETLFEVLPVGVVVADADGRLIKDNENMKETWGGDIFDAESIADYDRYQGWWADTGEPVDPEEWTMARVLNGEEVTDPDVYEIETVNGERRIVMIHGMPIRNEYGEITRGVITQTDITDRREYQRRLEESNKRLEQFAYAASHDLQEPLRMVSSYLQLLERRYSDEFDEDGQEFLEFAIDGADRMREMIEGLLEYSRVETQGDPFESVDLNEILEEVRANLQIQIKKTDAEIRAESLPQVEVDASQLRQVFQNLLENAIEYSGDEPPRIYINAEREGTKWLISVRDEGIGIDPDDQEQIFKVFQRLHTQDEHAGTGIGLALCQRVVERHGGNIWVESNSIRGSTFSFTLPVLDDHNM